MANTHSTAPDDGEPGPATRAWHYTPDLPLTVAPYYQWPCKPLAVARWLIGGWFPLSERLIILVLAISSWAFFHPAIETCRELSLDWVALIYLFALPMIYCQWAYFSVVRIFPAAIASIGTLAVPIVGVFSSAWLLGEPVGQAEILALILIVLALLVVLVLPALRKPKSPGVKCG